MELDKVLLAGKAASLGNFSERACEVFEEHAASLYDLLGLALSKRFDWDVFNFVDVDEVD